MTFSLWKLGFGQTDLTVTMIFSCFICGYPKFIYALICSELYIYVPGRKYKSPLRSLLSVCFGGLNYSWSFLSVFTSETTEVKQTASEKFRLFLIAPITDNHR